MKDKLNNLMNFDYVVNEVSSLAFNLKKDFKLKYNRFNENTLLMEDLKFECENFLYDKKAFPQIELSKDIFKEERLLSKYFNKKEIFIEDNKVTYFTSKEDDNIVLFESPITNKILLRYSNNFINEKEELLKQEKTDYRKSEVTEFLIKEDSCSEIDKLDIVLEESPIKINTINNMILQEYAIKFVTENAKSLTEDNCELAYNEVIKENAIACVLSHVDILTEDIVSTDEIICKEVYKNHYKYSLNKIYRS